MKGLWMKRSGDQCRRGERDKIWRVVKLEGERHSAKLTSTYARWDLCTLSNDNRETRGKDRAIFLFFYF